MILLNILILLNYSGGFMKKNTRNRFVIVAILLIIIVLTIAIFL